MLVVDHHRAERLAIAGREQEGGDLVALESAVIEPLKAETIGDSDVAALELHCNGIGKSEALAQGEAD